MVSVILTIALIIGGIALFVVVIFILSLYCKRKREFFSNNSETSTKSPSKTKAGDLESQVVDERNKKLSKLLDIESEILIENETSTPQTKSAPANRDLSTYNLVQLLELEPPSPTGTKVNTKTIFGWGNAKNGQLGLGRTDDEPIVVPRRLEFTAKIKSVSCANSHTLFLLGDGSLWSCGSNDHGQLGHDKGKSCPNKVEGLDSVCIVVISCGSTHNIVIDNKGHVYTWGSDFYGQLGLETQKSGKIVRRPRLVESLKGKVVQQVAAGEFHSVVLTLTGEIYTCGLNTSGQLGLGTESNQSKFTLVEKLTGFPSALITTGGNHCFALSVSGSVVGWGKNTDGQLGIGSNTDDQWDPIELPTLTSEVRFITAGLSHSVFLTKDGGVFTCGYGKYGQLGHASVSNEVLPRKILEFGAVVTQIACGRFHTLCWIKDRLYSFGLNSTGQLGLEFPDQNRDSPFHLQEFHYIVDSIFAGGDHSIALVECPDQSKLEQEKNVTIKDHRTFDIERQCLKITKEVMTKICSDEGSTLLEILFKSPSVWNASFLFPDKVRFASDTTLGVDLVQAEAILSRLGSVRSQARLTRYLCSMLQGGIKDLRNSLEIARIYLLIPLVPCFYSGTTAELPVLYAERVLRYNPDLGVQLLRGLYNAPADQVLRLISVYKKVILIILDDEKRKGKDIDEQMMILLRPCLIFLSLLNRMNKAGARFSYHAFVMPQLASKVDISIDFVKWRLDKYPGLYFCDFPFLFDAQAKTVLLQTDQILQMKNAMDAAVAARIITNVATSRDEDPAEAQFLVLAVSRSNLVNDVVNQISFLANSELKKPLTIKFIGEEAIDAGGVRKEFFLLLIREILDPKFGMFRNFEESRQMWFKADTFEEEIMYLVIGMLCGLAIYNNTIINLPFPLALYKKVLKEKLDLQDLKDLSPSEGRSLEQLLEYEGEDFEDVFGLNFELSQEKFGEVVNIELKPNGSNIPVTQENKSEFVDLYVSYTFDLSCKAQFEAFQEGFLRVCGSTVLELFNSQELQGMVTGNEDYDWGVLEETCEYREGFHRDEKTIKIFWEVFHDLDLFQKKQFLLFLTGSDRIPILGMKALKLIIQPAADERYLPVAHTCFNLIDLPRYQTKERMKYKILQAIQHNEGFELA